MADTNTPNNAAHDCLDEIDKLNDEADAASGIVWALTAATGPGVQHLPDGAIPDALCHVAGLIASIQARAEAIFAAYQSLATEGQQ